MLIKLGSDGGRCHSALCYVAEIDSTNLHDVRLVLFVNTFRLGCTNTDFWRIMSFEIASSFVCILSIGLGYLLLSFRSCHLSMLCRYVIFVYRGRGNLGLA